MIMEPWGYPGAIRDSVTLGSCARVVIDWCPASSLFKSIKGTGSKLIRASTYSPWNGAVNAKAPVRPLGLGGG